MYLAEGEMVTQTVPFHNFCSCILAGTAKQTEACPQRLDFSKQCPLKCNSLKQH